MKGNQNKRMKGLSNLFFQMGNSLNLSNIKTSIRFKHQSFVADDKEALKKDWNAVGDYFRTVLYGSKKNKRM